MHTDRDDNHHHHNRVFAGDIGHVFGVPARTNQHGHL